MFSNQSNIRTFLTMLGIYLGKPFTLTNELKKLFQPKKPLVKLVPDLSGPIITIMKLIIAECGNTNLLWQLDSRYLNLSATYCIYHPSFPFLRTTMDSKYFWRSFPCLYFCIIKRYFHSIISCYTGTSPWNILRCDQLEFL